MGYGPPSNTWFLGPTWVSPKRHLDRFSHFRSDHPCAQHSNRPHLCTARRRCGLLISMPMFTMISWHIGIARVHPTHLINTDSAPGGRWLSDQTNRLWLWVRRQDDNIYNRHRHLFLLISSKVDTHSSVQRENVDDLGTTVSVCSPCPTQYIAVINVINHGVIQPRDRTCNYGNFGIKLTLIVRICADYS